MRKAGCTRWAVLVMALLASFGCKKKETAPAQKSAEVPADAPTKPRVVELTTEVPGLSGLTRDEHGALWAPAERPPRDKPYTVLRIDPETYGITEYTVEGVPARTDLESIAWVDGTRFVLGTETARGGRSQDVILEGSLRGDKLVVSPIGQLEYALWGLTATSNDGIEGLCHVDGMLALATELSAKEQGRRWAPLATYDPNTQTWTAHWVALSSKDGVLAGMDCRSRGESIEVLAVERNIGARRLLRFLVPRGSVSERIEPVAVTRLGDERTGPNFEGLVWMSDGSAILGNDNQFGKALMGKSYLYFLAADEIR